MEEVLDAALERLDHHAVLFLSVANEVDHDVGLDGMHAWDPGAGLLFGAAVGDDPFDLVPAEAGVRIAGRAVAGDDLHVMPGSEEAGDKVAADMSSPADDEDVHGATSSAVCGRLR